MKYLIDTGILEPKFELPEDFYTAPKVIVACCRNSFAKIEEQIALHPETIVENIILDCGGMALFDPQHPNHVPLENFLIMARDATHLVCLSSTHLADINNSLKWHLAAMREIVRHLPCIQRIKGGLALKPEMQIVGIDDVAASSTYVPRHIAYKPKRAMAAHA